MRSEISAERVHHQFGATTKVAPFLFENIDSLFFSVEPPNLPTNNTIAMQ